MFTIDQIEFAHSKIKSGAEFPTYIQEIKSLGVISFVTWVKNSQTQYFGKDDFVVTSEPKYDAMNISPVSNKDQFVIFLQMHQKGETDYISFCRHCAETGIVKWVVNLEKMTCIYFDTLGNEVLIEKVPEK